MAGMPDPPTLPTFRSTFTVTEADTARALGSGDLPVLGTPRLLAWCEAATCAALVDLPTGRTSVGTRVELRHLAPNAVGDVVSVEATVTQRTERTAELTVTARHGDLVVGAGTVTRAIVDAARFMTRLVERADG